LLSAVGISSLVVWHNAKSADSLVTIGQSQGYARNYNAALAMGSLCLVAGVVYAVDFFMACTARKRIRREQY
jgi:hypothetical protein